MKIIFTSFLSETQGKMMLRESLRKFGHVGNRRLFIANHILADSLVLSEVNITLEREVV